MRFIFLIVFAIFLASGCYAERLPVHMASSVASIHGPAMSVECPPEHKLLSCGVQNSKTSGTTDINRYAIPASSTACECKDTAGAKCVAWCANVQMDFRITKNRIQHTGSVPCPTGYKVLHVTTISFMCCLF